MHLRPLEWGDLSRVVELQKESHPQEFWETQEAFENYLKWANDPSAIEESGAWGLEVDGVLVAYGFAYPWSEDSWPCLQLDEITPKVPCGVQTVWFIHDVVVSKDWRRLGFADQLVKRLLRSGLRRELKLLRAVAVNQSAPHWLAYGLQSVDIHLPQIYGSGAVALEMSLGNLSIPSV
jgi:hypothetical protein